MEMPNKHASLLYTLVYKARQIGESAPGSDAAFACYQIIDTAMNEAEIYDITLKEIGLEGFNPLTLLKASEKIACQRLHEASLERTTSHGGPVR